MEDVVFSSPKIVSLTTESYGVSGELDFDWTGCVGWNLDHCQW